MIKVVAFISAKPGISREAFVAHYESRHAPLIRRLLPMIGRYSRTYIHNPPMWRPDEPGPGFDVITELEFADQAAFDAFQRTLRDPAVAREIAADEAHFLDRAKTRLHVGEEFASVEDG